MVFTKKALEIIKEAGPIGRPLFYEKQGRLLRRDLCKLEDEDIGLNSR